MDTAIITVRSSSSRLPRKCYLPFGNITVLEHIIKRVEHYNLKPIVCTSSNTSDHRIVKIAKNLKVDYFCGSSINKLQRWRDCCKDYDIKIFHTVDADDLFFCGEEVNRSLDLLKTGYDMVSPSPSASNGGCTVGFSLTSDIVEKACERLSASTDTEMMWNFIKKVDDAKIIQLDDPKHSVIHDRMTLDYPEDYIMLNKIRSLVGNLASREQIHEILLNNPEISKINNFRNSQWLNNQRIKSKEING